MIDRDTYGTTLHVTQYEELAHALAPIDGAHVVRLGRHPLVIPNEAVLYPLRYSNGLAPVGQARLRRPISLRRIRLFVAHGPEPMQPALHPDFELAEVSELKEAFPEIGEGIDLILIAYACSLESGVMNPYWGEAELANRGRILWHVGEPLPDSGQQDGGSAAGPSAVRPVPTGPAGPEGGTGRRFDDGKLPEFDFPARPRKVDEPSSETEPGTEADSSEEE